MRIIQSASALHLWLQWERFVVTQNLRFQEITFENIVFKLSKN